MAGGVSGAASGGILGLVLVLLAQQFGYVDFSNLISALILMILVIFVFAVVFGILGIILKGSAIRRAKAQSGLGKEGDTPAATASPSTAPAADSPSPPADPGTPPST
ncbi:MAG: hypothetical protein L3K10_03520 [Thermoplasmata archaeon]|nr:hypothetical protein [Thermoplasmata archaeon]